MEYCPAIKRIEIAINATTWMNIKGIIPNEKYDSIYIVFLKLKNGDSEHVSDCQGLMMGRKQWILP
jgi:hypothetical protein